MSSDDSGTGGRAGSTPKRDRGTSDDRPGSGDSRTTGDQRRYNRRTPVSDASPPYYDIFARIATALEGIERLLQKRVIDVDERRRGSRSAGPQPSG